MTALRGRVILGEASVVLSAVLDVNEESLDDVFLNWADGGKQMSLPHVLHPRPLGYLTPARLL